MSLLIKNLSVFSGKKQILKDINLEINKGTIYVLMGPNGSGKTTLALSLMGSGNYEFLPVRTGGIKNYELKIDGKNIRNLKPDERARMGLFLAFQNPVAIPGVSVANLLRTAYQAIHKQTKNRRSWVESSKRLQHGICRSIRFL